MGRNRGRSFWRTWGSGNSLSFRPMSPVSEQSSSDDGIARIISSETLDESKVFTSSGDRLIEQGSYNTAVYMYDEALKFAPADTTILLSRSLAHMLSDPPAIDAAHNDVKQCLELDPKNWQAWQLKGDLLMREDNFKDAEPAFRNAIAYSKGMDKVRAQRSLADARSKAGAAIAVGSGTTGSRRNASIVRRAVPRHEPDVVPPATVPAPSETQTPVEAVTTQPEQVSIRPEDQEPVPSQRLTRRGSRIIRQPSVQRADTAASIHQTQSQRLPLQSADIIELTSTDNDTPDDAPPGYSPRTVAPPQGSDMSNEELINRANALNEKLSGANKGSLILKAYTGNDNIDGVAVLLAGLPLEETLSAELPVPLGHPSFEMMTIVRSDYPGNTYNDMDAEAIAFYAAKYPGTIMVAGFSQEYREQQLRQQPHVNIFKQSEKSLPIIAVKDIMERIQAIQANPQMEDDAGLQKFLGLSMVDCLTTGFHAGGTRQKRIESICMIFTHTVNEEPDRFPDLAQRSPFAYIFAPGADDHIRNFFYQILIGAELLIRLRKEPANAEYRGFVTDHLSTVMVIASEVLIGFNISPRAESDYVFFPIHHQQQAAALLQFAESIQWPYLDEARDKIENAFMNMVNDEAVPMLLLDWFFGIVGPGRIFRHRIMACLVLCSPTIAGQGVGKFWNEGVVVKDKSYWPQRSILGSVFGALRSSKMVCGWVTAPAPEGDKSGYFYLRARLVEIPTPLRSESLARVLAPYYSNPTEMVLSLTNAEEYINTPQPLKPTGSAVVTFKSYKLELLPGSIPGAPAGDEYRPILYFDVDGKEVSFSLYSNPLFVAATPCRGGPHLLHRVQAQAYLKNTVHVKDLKELSRAREDLLVIYTSGDQEELLARAWCAERGRHAVVRRQDALSCCFACAAEITVDEMGLGIGVLIWSCNA